MKKNNDSLNIVNEAKDTAKSTEKKQGGLHDGHRQRMFNKYFTNGIESLEEHEILEVALYSVFPRCNTNEISHALLNRFSSILGVFNASIDELCDIENINKATAIKIKFIGDLLKHTSAQTAEVKRFYSTKDIVEYCKFFTEKENRELLIMLFLDQNNTLISHRICRGYSDNVSANIKLMIKYISDTDCKKLVLIHNHLNDQVNASYSDIKSTRRLMDLLDQLNIRLLDHIIIGTGNNYQSFHENKVIEGL